MKKLCILTALIGAISVSGFSGSVMAEGSALIENGDFENGINGFGICYSSKEDTVMPSLRESNSISKEGAALELIPGESLSAAASSSPVSDGFAYQGVYHKNTFDVSKGVKYTISADAYPSGSDVKMRFVVISKNRAVAVSDEFSVPADRWSSNTFGWVSDTDIEDVRVRVVFYDIRYGKSVYLDNLECSEAIVSNNQWQPMNDEEITVQGGSLTFTTAAGEESGIYAVTDSSEYESGVKYGLVAEVSAAAEKAYFTAAVGAEHRDYIVKNGDTVKILLPFEAKAGEDVTFNITSLTEGASSITLIGLEVVDEYRVINAERVGDNLTVSGVLRGGNEDKEIKIQLGDIGIFTTTTNSAGGYTLTEALPAMSEPQKAVRISISEINGYTDVGGVLSTDYVLYNSAYADSVAAQVSGATSSQIKTVLTEEVMDNLGVSSIPAVRTADTDDICTYIAGKTVANGGQLIDEIKVGAALSSLDAKEQSLCGITDEYADLLGADKVAAYNDIYANADKSALNDMFKECRVKIDDLTSYEYALTETLVRYEMKSEVNYSQQLELLKKYAADLGLDFTEYNRLPSVKQYSVAAEWLKDIRATTDYSKLQGTLDALVTEAKKDNNDGGSSSSSGIGFGGGGGGGVGIKTDEIKQEPIAVPEETEEYRFTDLDGHEWAQTSIYALVDKGVISKPGDKLFNPADNVTRAEMAKMTAILFNIAEYAGDEQKFTDVTSEDWYYGYVMALFENEIVKGISDTEYGSQQPITRQDICVILARLLGGETAADGEAFTDIDTASDYAREAIALMKQTGVINGYEDGSFRPLGYATRAEISQILYNISNR